MDKNGFQELFNKETAPLIERRKALEIEYADIEDSMLSVLDYGSYIGLLFSEPHSELYEVYNYYFKDKLTYGGLICFYPGAMPGDEGMITLEELNEMVEDGWQYSVYWSGDGDLAEYLVAMRLNFDSLGLAFPDVVTFKQGAYSTSLDSILLGHGIMNAIHHGEDGRKISEVEAGDGVWRPGALSWNTIGYSNALLVEVIKYGGIAYFEMNFTGDHEKSISMSDTDRVLGFGRMLNTIQSCILNKEISVLSLDEAKEGRRRYLDCEDDMLEYIEYRRAEIAEEIDAIDAEINRIYNKYFG